jgi:hypothetical protein
LKLAAVLTLCVLLILLIYEGFSVYNASFTIHNSGSIFIEEKYYVKPFGFRIADMMADLLLPNFDDKWYSTHWQEALDDLAEASPNGEITHVQMRIWWRINTGEGTNASDWINPQLGSADPTQGWIMQNWKRWYFGYIAPGEQPLAYGPCALERIRQKGFKFELAISGAWENGDIVKPPMFYWGGKEANYPDWVALGGGDKFLDNYLNNVLLPVANFAKDYLENGDIFCLSFEMVYPTADFTWSHNEKWKTIVNTIRNVFRSAGKSIVLTSDEDSWYDDFGLGYNAVKLLNPDAPITQENQGISGATWLGELDFISLSWWNPVLKADQIKENWTLSDYTLVRDAWFNNLNEYKVGTGYSGVPGVLGRDYIADLRAFSQIMGKKVLMNSGYFNRHGWLAWSSYGGEKFADNIEQCIAWAGHLAAIADPRSNFTLWCAGQDFERYCRDKGEQPTYIDTSWRNAPAQEAIIGWIRTITKI